MASQVLDGAPRWAPTRAGREADPAATHAAWDERRRALEQRRCRSTPNGSRRPGGTPRPVLEEQTFRLGLLPRVSGIAGSRMGWICACARSPSSCRACRMRSGATGCCTSPTRTSTPRPASRRPSWNGSPGSRSTFASAPAISGRTTEAPSPRRGFFEPLAALRRSVEAADGFLATLGNHDCADMVAPLQRLGFEVMLNRSRRLARGGAEILVTGVDDVHRFYTPAAAAALGALEPGMFGLALVHSPEFAGEAAAAGYDLYLCGHTHAGQVCLPGGRPVVTNLSRHQRLACGLWRYRAMTGYTSPGAGLSSLPVRFNCPPEVTLFILEGRAGEP